MLALVVVACLSSTLLTARHLHASWCEAPTETTQDVPAPVRGEAAPADAKDPKADKPDQKPKPGIPVTDMLIQARCVGCHPRDERGHMTRISYMRKSPEGWQDTLRRMGRLYQVQLTPAEAKHMVRYLANEHGLTRSEAERALYESERRVHWSEEHHEVDFKQACAQCHPLGRVLNQQRDEEEWQLLRATHVAYFPLSRGQMGGGPPRNEEEEAERRFWRNRMGQGQGGGAGGGGAGGTGASGAGAASATAPNPGTAGAGTSSTGTAGAAGARRGGPDAGNNPNDPSPDEVRERDRGDRVLKRLAQEQPLLTPAWEQWQISKRETPLAGRWFALAHEVGRGAGFGTFEIVRTGADEFATRWQLTWSDGTTQERSCKGLLYAGYSWRGSASEGDTTWREVMLLDAPWRSFKGRVFRGDHDELGADVALHRLTGTPRVLAVRQPAVTVPAQGHALEVLGEAFPDNVQAGDFHLGTGVTVTRAEWLHDGAVRLLLDVSPQAACGERPISYLADPGTVRIVLYDGIDYVRVAPTQGLARIGGERARKQLERFEAIAVHRGKDGKPFTDDDVDVMAVKARWSLAEFAVRDDDDDVQYVGTIDAETGLFTPAVDGPNLQRKWQANNVGNVFVVAEGELLAPVRVEPRKEKEPASSAEEDKPSANGKPNGEPAAAPPSRPLPNPAAPPPPSGKPDLQRKPFKARGHLLVTVPRYIRFDRLEWEDR
jgi:quinohemoprotein amine dehydrogenase